MGRLRGAAIIGQGLDVSVPVQADAGEALTGLCLDAEVFHADTRQDASRVRVTVEPAAASQSGAVRIRSTTPIDEPVVTVYLSAGCTQKVTRRYVMLADIVSEQAPVAAAPAPQVPLVVPADAAPAAQAAVAAPVRPDAGSAGGTSAGMSASAAATGAASAAPPRSADPAAPVKRAAAPVQRKPAAARAAAPAPSKAAPAAAPAATARPAGQSRLKLDPLEVLSERVATLESSSASAPAEQAARESRDAQRLEALENSVKNLLAVATRNEASMMDLRTRLQQAEADRYANPLVYGLAGLLLLSLAGIAYLLGRQNSARAANGRTWWGAVAEHPDEEAERDEATAPARRSGFSPMSSPGPLTGPDALAAADASAMATQRSGPPSRAAPITQVDVSLVEMSESTFDRLMQSGTTHSAVRKPRPPEPTAPMAPVAPSTRRLINSDDLFDIRQQAEFFVSLGQTDQAVRILENRISESGESSPLAYLDLMKIFHSLGLKADFRQVREDFNLLFNVRVPEFAGFDNEGRDLEAYPEILATLADVWGKPEVFANIEALLFRDQWTSQREALDLAAFRDLLMLHAVAQIAATLPDALQAATERSIPRSPFSPASKFMPQALAPTAVTEALPELDASGSVDVDIDLDIDLSGPDLSAPPVVPQVTAAQAADPGNLIDFDLPELPPIPPSPKAGA